MRTLSRLAVGASWGSEPCVQLMTRVKHNDPGAFEELLRLFWPRVFGRLQRYMGDRQLAEDLTQEVFLRLYRNRQSYQPRARFTTWLFHIVLNVARNAVRTRRRKPAVSMSALDFGVHHERLEAVVGSRQPETPERPADRAEITIVVRDAINRLAYRQRAALELQIKDRSYLEIADELNMTPKAAKSLLYRAKLELREALHPYVSLDLL